MANLYIDEDLSNFVSPLQEAGHTVHFAGEVGPGRTDAWHLAKASREQRTLITFNERDYRYLHRLWTSLRIFGLFSRRHSGILTATAQLEPNAWVPELNLLLKADQQMAERMWIWHPAVAEWREDKWRPED